MLFRTLGQHALESLDGLLNSLWTDTRTGGNDLRGVIQGRRLRPSLSPPRLSLRLADRKLQQGCVGQDWCCQQRVWTNVRVKLVNALLSCCIAMAVVSFEALSKGGCGVGGTMNSVVPELQFHVSLKN